MVQKSDKIRLKRMLADSITVLCRAGLPFQSKFQVDALIGITLDDNEVVLVSFNETVSANGSDFQSDWPRKNDDEEEEQEEEGNECASEPEQTYETSTPTSNDYGSNSWGAATRKVHPNKPRSARTTETAVHTSASLKNTTRGWHRPVSRRTDVQNIDAEYSDQYAGSIKHENDPSDLEVQMKSEPCDVDYGDDDDDCLILKTEEQDLEEHYAISDNQQWDVEGEGFTDNCSANLQNMAEADRLASSGYEQEPTWPSYTAKSGTYLVKPGPGKRPLHHRRQRWTTGPTSTCTKSKKAATQKQLHSRSEIANDEVVRVDDLINTHQQLNCSVCGIQANTVQSLREHINGVHLNLNRYSCEFCHQTFKWRMALSRHRRNFHKLFIRNASKIKTENQEFLNQLQTA